MDQTVSQKTVVEKGWVIASVIDAVMAGHRISVSPSHYEEHAVLAADGKVLYRFKANIYPETVNAPFEDVVKIIEDSWGKSDIPMAQYWEVNLRRKYSGEG